jgi:hypothetical protein
MQRAEDRVLRKPNDVAVRFLRSLTKKHSTAAVTMAMGRHLGIRVAEVTITRWMSGSPPRSYELAHLMTELLCGEKEFVLNHAGILEIATKRDDNEIRELAIAAYCMLEYACGGMPSAQRFEEAKDTIVKAYHRHK